ncbi:MAG: phosphoadenosine phosphosulfate reductase [Rhodobacteraceae bacterium]|nr:phosphoadenosine phosphosulfate reductase [Paracoccaceae bacterium]
MQTDSPQLDQIDADTPLSAEDWCALIEEVGERNGFFEPVGTNHFALFNDDSPTLLVTFETVEGIRAEDPAAMPLGQRVATSRGWSSLTLIARSRTWFRDPEVHAFFDRLVDEAFFEEFDRVVFFGAGMCGYAAAAYSVTAPGATVLLVAPQATLEPARAGWDPRFAGHRRLCFTDRYGYAPDMIEGAGPVFVVYDPRESLDAMHAALFARPFVTRLPCRGAGGDIAGMLDRLEITPAMLRLAAEGRFTAAAFWRLWRARRTDQPYLRDLVTRLGDHGALWRAALVCRNALARLNAPRFARSLAQLDQMLEDEGRALPVRRRRPA